MVDARGNDPDPLGIGSVETHELPGLLRRRREDHVGVADHALLASQAFERLRRFPAGERVVLDLAERVERGHERDAEDLLGRAADPTRQPVVAVDQVVVVALLPRHPEHAAEELRQIPLHRGLRQRLARTRLRAHDADPRRDLADVVRVASAAPREEVDLDPLTGEALGHRSDVDVHPAGVTGSRLVDGRGVDGEDGDARRIGSGAHGQVQPPTGVRFIPSMVRTDPITSLNGRSGAGRRPRPRPVAPRRPRTGSRS